MNQKKNIKLFSVISVFLFILVLSSTAAASDLLWNQFHKDTAHTGFSSGKGPHTNNLLWVSDPIWATPSSSPVIADGKVFVKCGTENFLSLMPSLVEENRVVALDELTGIPLFNSSVGELEGSWSSPCYSNSKVWCGRTKNGVGGTVVADGKIFDSNNSEHLYYCTSEETGKKLWSFEVTGDVRGTPAYSNDKVYLTSGPLFSSPGYVYCVDAESGKEIWNQKLSYQPGGSPAVSDGVVYVTVYNGGLYALSANNGSILWNETIPSTDVSSTPAIAYGNVYISGGCPGFSTIQTYCYNITTHELVWSTSAEEQIGGWTSSVAVADGMVFVGKHAEGDYFGHAGTYALDAFTGNVVWSSPYGGASPAVSDGIVFTIGADGCVYAFADPAEVLPSVSIKCNTSNLEFGSLAPGKSSSLNLNIINAGNSDATVSAEIGAGSSQLYKDSLFFSSTLWNQYSKLVSSKKAENMELVLNVPAAYGGDLGKVGGNLIFWVETA